MAKRRRFTPSYKRRIVEQADQSTQVGEVEALLRREGLYSSHLAKWRKQVREGTLDSLKAPTENVKRTKQLEAENKRLKQQLEQASAVIEVQKKLSDLLGLGVNGEKPS